MRSCKLRVTLVWVCCLAGTLAGPAAALAAAPTVTSISHNNGTYAGGTSVVITGTGFISGSTVKFGSTAATGVTVVSSTTITATSPAGTGTVGVSVTNSNGTSALVPADQFAYDSTPGYPWLGLNGNSSTYLGPVDAFVEHNIAYDRSGPIEWEAGQLPKTGDGLAADIENGMIPDITIEYKGYPGCEWGHECLPTGSAITTYVTGFVKSAESVLKTYPGKQILFEPINEPYGYGTAAQYANIVAKLLLEAEKAGIPLNDIYVAAYGKRWVPKMYEAQSKLETEVQGWYFHPYGPPEGTAEENSQGIQSLPFVQAEMTSGQNNIIVSEVGYCTPDVNKGEKCGTAFKAENSTQAAQWLTEMLDNALPYHEAGWLKALIVYSRNDGGWAMQVAGGALTKQGEALETFGNVYGVLAWSIQSTPNREVGGGAVPSYLEGVSCSSATACTATGWYSSGTLAERWNGSGWSIQATPNPSGGTGSHFAGVSCSSSITCTATGYFINSSGHPVTLAERWNGSEWSIQATPNRSGGGVTFYSDLEGVSCPSSTACTATGWEQANTGTSFPLAERWNGSEWSIQSTPEPAEGTESHLEGVSCSSSTLCIATGSYRNSSGTRVTLAEGWNGSEWSIQSTPNPAGAVSSYLQGVSCWSTMACIATGSYTNGSGTTLTLAERWNGSGWSIQSPPNPSGATQSFLKGVSCLSSTGCTATGYYLNASGTPLTLAERWNGSGWSIQSTPNPSGAKQSYLNGVSCVSLVTCIAAGEYEPSSGTVATLAEGYL